MSSQVKTDKNNDTNLRGLPGGDSLIWCLWWPAAQNCLIKESSQKDDEDEGVRYIPVFIIYVNSSLHR